MARLKTLTFENQITGTSVSYEIGDATIGTDEFSSSVAYEIDDYCVYNNTLYKCINPVTAGSDFNSSDWVATSVRGEIEDIQEEVSMLGYMVVHNDFYAAIDVEDGDGSVLADDDDTVILADWKNEYM